MHELRHLNCGSYEKLLSLFIKLMRLTFENLTFKFMICHVYHFIKINILSPCPHKDWYMNVCRSFMHNSPKVETIHRSIIRRVNQQNVLYSCDGILLCPGKEQLTDTCKIIINLKVIKPSEKEIRHKGRDNVWVMWNSGKIRSNL